MSRPLMMTVACVGMRRRRRRRHARGASAAAAQTHPPSGPARPGAPPACMHRRRWQHTQVFRMLAAQAWAAARARPPALVPHSGSVAAAAAAQPVGAHGACKRPTDLAATHPPRIWPANRGLGVARCPSSDNGSKRDRGLPAAPGDPGGIASAFVVALGWVVKVLGALPPAGPRRGPLPLGLDPQARQACMHA